MAGRRDAAAPAQSAREVLALEHYATADWTALAEAVCGVIEAHPGTLDRAAMESLRRAGVNRLSVGAQSFDEQDSPIYLETDVFLAKRFGDGHHVTAGGG